MREVAPNLSVGSLFDCPLRPGAEENGLPRIVHACKYPCFVSAAGFPQPGSVYYLTFSNGRHLYMNLIDPEEPLFMTKSFEDFLHFMSLSPRREVLIHCNSGLSRSPALAMLYLEARSSIRRAFDDACTDYKRRDPPASLSRGIKLFLREHWEELLDSEPARRLRTQRGGT